MNILLYALVGLAAQLIDGALGMAFGVTATTLLLFSAVTPAHASAAVHLAELGTTLAAGISHWKLRNVHWPTVVALGIPGAIGSFLGAYVLSSLPASAAQPAIAVLLVLLGFYVLIRSIAIPWDRSRTAPSASTRSSRWGMGILGVVGGFLDASGGGGWGPLTTSTLMSVGRAQPRTIIGTVNTAEFLVALAASAGFLAGLRDQLQQSWQPVLGLLVGGMLAAPLAAWAVTVVKAEILGAVVGGLLIVLNASRLVMFFGWEGAVSVVFGGLVLVGLLVGYRKRKLVGEARKAKGKTQEYKEVVGVHR